MIYWSKQCAVLFFLLYDKCGLCYGWSFLNRIDGEIMDYQELEKRIQEKAQNVDGKAILSCSVALQIANDLSCSPKQVGEICNRLKIKIANCQLGCF